MNAMKRMTNEMFCKLMKQINLATDKGYILCDKDEYGIFHNAINEEEERIAYNDGFPVVVKEDPNETGNENLWIMESEFAVYAEDIIDDKNFEDAKNKAHKILWKMGSFIYTFEEDRICGEAWDFKISIWIDLDVEGNYFFGFHVERTFEDMRGFAAIDSDTENYLDLLKELTSGKFDPNLFDHVSDLECNEIRGDM
tara:strand:- start:319 stop:909 length:591 start_codon:yes stop_codon:yes gene_type:complete